LTAARFVTRSLAAALLLCVPILWGCHTQAQPSQAGAAAPASAAGWPRTLTDDSGASITLPSPPSRIVSLAPSNTEILFALGVGDRVVADTGACDYPPEALQKPHVGGMSAGDLERIQVLFPDLVVAVGSINQKLVAALRAAHIPTVVVQPHTTDEVLASMRLIGKAIGKDGEAERLATDAKGRMDHVRATTSRAAARPRTLIAYTDEPIYTSPPDSFIHDLIGVAGGDDIVKEPLPQNIISSAVVIERAPEVIICSARLRPRLKALPGLSSVPAVKNDRFFTTTCDAELTRPGPRMAAGVEQLARFLHPELFPAGADRAKR
jgi:iron complex transport system substrate-binding protein